jgi:hypothetical protein
MLKMHLKEVKATEEEVEAAEEVEEEAKEAEEEEEKEALEVAEEEEEEVAEEVIKELKEKKVLLQITRMTTEVNSIKIILKRDMTELRLMEDLMTNKTQVAGKVKEETQKKVTAEAAGETNITKRTRQRIKKHLKQLPLLKVSKRKLLRKLKLQLNLRSIIKLTASSKLKERMLKATRRRLELLRNSNSIQNLRTKSERTMDTNPLPQIYFQLRSMSQKQLTMSSDSMQELQQQRTRNSKLDQPEVAEVAEAEVAEEAEANREMAKEERLNKEKLLELKKEEVTARPILPMMLTSLL